MSASSAHPAPNPAEITRALGVLFEDDQIVELRAIAIRGRKHTDAGYFDGSHRPDLAKHACRLNSDNAAVYVTINTIDPQLMGRYANRIEPYASVTTSDSSVVRRRWLLLDFDPVRPAGTSATDAQVAAARDVASGCADALDWPAPVVADSGNGVHLLYPIDLPNDAASTSIVKGVLAELARRFDTDLVKVDQAVYNAARIVKLYGTVANKGDSTPETPWRLSRIVSGVRGPVVTLGQLRALAPPEAPATARAYDDSGFDLDAFLGRMGIEYEQDVWQGADRYKLAHCAFNEEHVHGESAVFRQPNGRLGYKCYHSSCAGKDWHALRETVDGARAAVGIRAKGEAAWPEVPPVEAYADDHEARPGPGAAPGAEAVYRCVSDIVAKPVRWLWKGRITRGKVTVLAGHPGLGKSQATISMAAIVTIGGAWPVDRSRCELGSVVILSAEDDAADTIRPRLEAAGADLDRAWILEAVREIGRDGTPIKRTFNLGEDIGRLKVMVEGIGKVALIVIDPITAYLGRVDSHKNAEVRGVLAPLAEMAAETGSAVVCVSHLNKASAGTEAAMLRVMGSVGFVGAARGAYLIAKDPDDEDRRLFLPMKNNLAKDLGGLAFRVVGRDLGKGIETSCVEWGSEIVTMTAEAALAPVVEGEPPATVNTEWLRDLLKDGGREVAEIRKEAKGAGISSQALRYAREKLGIQPYKRGYQGAWWWALDQRCGSPDEGGDPPVKYTTAPHLWNTDPLKPSCGAGSSKGVVAHNDTPPSTPLKPSCDAGSAQDAVEAQNIQRCGGVFNGASWAGNAPPTAEISGEIDPWNEPRGRNVVLGTLIPGADRDPWAGPPADTLIYHVTMHTLDGRTIREHCAEGRTMAQWRVYSKKHGNGRPCRVEVA